MIFAILIILSGIPYGVFAYKYCIDNFFAQIFMHLSPMIFIFTLDSLWDTNFYNPYLLYLCLLSILTRFVCEVKKNKEMDTKR